jgi:hypothetical protein
LERAGNWVALSLNYKRKRKPRRGLKEGKSK